MCLAQIMKFLPYHNCAHTNRTTWKHSYLLHKYAEILYMGLSWVMYSKPHNIS